MQTTELDKYNNIVTIDSSKSLPESRARDDDEEEEEEEEDGVLPAPAAAAEVARDAKPETLSDATKAVKEALGTVVKKAIDAGLKYYERQTDMNTVYKKLTTA